MWRFIWTDRVGEIEIERGDLEILMVRQRCRDIDGEREMAR